MTVDMKRPTNDNSRHEAKNIAATLPQSILQPRRGALLSRLCAFRFHHFILMACCVSASSGREATPGQQPAQGDVQTAPIPRSQIARELWQTRVTVPKSEEEQYGKELRQIIQRIRSISFEQKEQTPERTVAVKPVIKVEPNQTRPVLEKTQPPIEKQTEPDSDTQLPYKSLANETLQTLKDMSEDPNRMRNPLELAEIMYLSGNKKEAAVFYQQALSRKITSDAASAGDKAWILFQIGNCLRDEDMPAAKKSYRQLITEYPESLWTDLAKSQEKLIDWYLTDKPRSLIAASKL